MSSLIFQWTWASVWVLDWYKNLSTVRKISGSFLIFVERFNQALFYKAIYLSTSKRLKPQGSRSLFQVNLKAQSSYIPWMIYGVFEISIVTAEVLRNDYRLRSFLDNTLKLIIHCQKTIPNPFRKKRLKITLMTVKICQIWRSIKNFISKEGKEEWLLVL